MDSTRLFPERIIAGFAHLIWFTLFAMILIDVNPYDLVKFISELNTGGVALLTSVLIGASFYFGLLAEQVITDVVKIIMQLFNIESKPIINLSNVREKEPEEVRDLENKYTGKAFFRSIGLAGFFIIVFSIWLNALYGKPNIRCAIIILGFLIEVLTWRIVFTFMKEYSSQYDKLYKKSNATKNKSLSHTN